MRLLDIFVLVTCGGLLLALAIMMVRRRLQREYPFFFGYVAFSFLAGVAVFAVSGNNKAYLYSYWTADALNIILAVLALHEAFYDVFHRFYSFWWFRLIFPGVVAVIFVFAIRYAILKPIAHASRLISVIFTVDTAVGYVQVGLVVIFMLLAVGWHVRWRDYPYAIALGLAVSSLGVWMAFLVRAEFGTKYSNVVRYAPPTAFLCATIVWLWSFSGKLEPDPKLERQDAVARSRRPDASSTPKLTSV